jgi:hypothetical protein
MTEMKTQMTGGMTWWQRENKSDRQKDRLIGFIQLMETDIGHCSKLA